jgi:hypothetical protein
VIGDDGRSGGWCRVEQRGAWPNGGREKVERAAASSVLTGAGIRGANPHGAAMTDGH